MGALKEQCWGVAGRGGGVLGEEGGEGWGEGAGGWWGGVEGQDQAQQKELVTPCAKARWRICICVYIIIYWPSFI